MHTIVTGKGGFQLVAGLFLAAGLLMAAETSLGQNADDGFNPNAHGMVYAIAVQPDGKVLLGGDFDAIGGVARTSVARVLPDGRLDTPFAPGVIPDSIVKALAVQADGKVIIGGEFSEVAGQIRYNLARLNADGSLDATFNPNTVATEADKAVSALVIQPDGKIIVGGDFVNLGGQTRSFIGRLNADGSLDTAFNPTANGDVNAIVLQPDGKILVGGDFSLIGGANRLRVARLNADGSIDSTFTQTNGASDAVTCLAIQADGKIIVGGHFTELAGSPRNYLGRLNTDGSLDASFAVAINDLGASIKTALIQPDGKILIGGDFFHLDGVVCSCVGRLNANGSVDTGFNPPGGANCTVHALAIQPDKGMLVGGEFSQLASVDRNFIGRLYPNGSPDNNFLDADVNPALGSSSTVYAMAQQTDGRLVVGGAFQQLSGVNRNRIGRFAVDGTLDAAFNPNADGTVRTIVIQSDGKILMGGFFTHLGLPEYKYIARLDSAGNPEAGFNPQLDGGGVYCIVPQPDGKIIVAGEFTKIGIADGLRIGCLNNDGTLDSAFTVPSGADGSIYSAFLQPNGKIVVAGDFTHLGGVARNHIGRLNSDGSLDTTFDPNTNNGGVYTLALQPDGKILLGGTFTAMGVDAADCKKIGRLNSDGTLDTSFAVPNGADASVQSIGLQPDGKIMVGGAFTKIGGLDRLYVARLDTNGSVDPDYVPPNGTDNWVRGLVLQPDGKVIAGGLFENLTGHKRNYIGRLSTVSAASQNLAVNLTSTAIIWTRTGSGPELDTVMFEQSLDGTTWSTLGAGSRLTNGWQITGLILPHKTNLYLRARGFYRCSYYNSSVSICESVRLFYLPNRIDGDFDGDGKSDLAVYRDGYWSIFSSLANAMMIDNGGPFGGPGWIPVH